MTKEETQLPCCICKQPLPDPAFAGNYPNFVCRECGQRAVNENGDPPHHLSQYDDGENPVFIDSKKCWRRYRYGGYITMLDELDCRDIGEFYDKYNWIG
jgi:hypothetical protein